MEILVLTIVGRPAAGLCLAARRDGTRPCGAGHSTGAGRRGHLRAGGAGGCLAGPRNRSGQANGGLERVVRGQVRGVAGPRGGRVHLHGEGAADVAWQGKQNIISGASDRCKHHLEFHAHLALCTHRSAL